MKASELLVPLIMCLCLAACGGSGSSGDGGAGGNDGGNADDGGNTDDSSGSGAGGDDSDGDGDGESDSDSDDDGGTVAVIWPIGASTLPDCVQDTFGHRLLGGDHDFHPGVDTCEDDPDEINGTETGTISGLPVHAVASGEVVRVRLWDPAWTDAPEDCPSFCRQGNFVVIDHSGQEGFGDDSVQTIYMHLAQDSVLVDEGETVMQGEQIALVGETGNGINTVHLHLGFLRGIETPGDLDADNYVNPFAYLPHAAPAGSTAVEKALLADPAGIFDADECEAVNVLEITVSQDKPFYNMVRIEVPDEANDSIAVLDIDQRVGIGTDGDQDDFEQGCVAVVPENHDKSSTKNVLHVYFGSEWDSADVPVTLRYTGGGSEVFQ